MKPVELYAAMVKYLEKAGWQRTDPESAWWFHKDHYTDESMGDAVTEQLFVDGIDIRFEP